MHPTLIELLVKDRQAQRLRDARGETTRSLRGAAAIRSLVAAIRPSAPPEPWLGGINVAAQYPWG